MVSTSDLHAININYQKWNEPADLNVKDHTSRIKFEEKEPKVVVFPNFETVEELLCRSCGKLSLSSFSVNYGS